MSCFNGTAGSESMWKSQQKLVSNITVRKLSLAVSYGFAVTFLSLSVIGLAQQDSGKFATGYVLYRVAQSLTEDYFRSSKVRGLRWSDAVCNGKVYISSFSKPEVNKLKREAVATLTGFLTTAIVASLLDKEVFDKALRSIFVGLAGALLFANVVSGFFQSHFKKHSPLYDIGFRFLGSLLTSASIGMVAAFDNTSGWVVLLAAASSTALVEGVVGVVQLKRAGHKCCPERSSDQLPGQPAVQQGAVEAKSAPQTPDALPAPPVALAVAPVAVRDVAVQVGAEKEASAVVESPADDRSACSIM